MEILSQWVKQSNPLVKMTMAIAFTSAVVVGLKYGYRPYVRKSRLQQAEEWANQLIEQEERNTEYDIS